MKKTWEIINKQKRVNSNEGINKIINVLLKNRGLTTKKQIDEFLNPPDPYTLNPQSIGINSNQLTKAIQRIKQAVAKKELIIIYGDYDADGVCATAILWETLHHLSAKVLPFIPNREELGYGLKKEGINYLLKTYPPTNLPTLIITVDNGIVALSGTAYAQEKGMDVIITDHHQPPKKLPKAHSIIWSDKVSGAGVAWFLAKAIYQHFHKNLIGFKASNSLELAGIGTVTDMMPMLNVNRSLVKFGLKELRKSKRLGIRSLCQISGINQNKIETYHLGYIIGPRLNAMGRLEDALESLRLLCTKNQLRADGLASKLHLTNRTRQDLTQATLNHAKSNLKLNPPANGQKTKLIFISHSSYNQGVIGLVAGKLVEEFYRPAVIISQGEKYSKGSVRSIAGFDIIKALRQFNDCFEDLGGHPMAAGFTIATDKIKLLEKKLSVLTKKEIPEQLLQPVIKADLEINLDNINHQLYKEIEKFAPFGLANPKPVFISRKVKVINFRSVGRDNQHLKLTIQLINNSTIFNTIAFNLGSLAKKLKNGQLIDICYSLEKNNWNNQEKLELRIKDINLSSSSSKRII